MKEMENKYLNIAKQLFDDAQVFENDENKIFIAACAYRTSADYYHFAENNIENAKNSAEKAIQCFKKCNDLNGVRMTEKLIVEMIQSTKINVL